MPLFFGEYHRTIAAPSMLQALVIAVAIRFNFPRFLYGLAITLLLGGGLLIGYLYGHDGLSAITPVLLGGFKTLLALFLLEMGLCTAKVCSPLPLKQWRLMLFALLAPFVLAWFGIALGLLLGLPGGSILVLAGLMASASYIAAPAAIRAAVPDADIGLALLASLGLTFPLNVLLGLPLYLNWVNQLLN